MTEKFILELRKEAQQMQVEAETMAYEILIENAILRKIREEISTVKDDIINEFIRIAGPQMEAEKIIDDAKKEAKRLVSESCLLKNIRKQADEIKAKVIAECKEIKKDAGIPVDSQFCEYGNTQHMFDDYWFVIPKNKRDGYIAKSTGEAVTEAKFWRYEGLTGGDYEFVLMVSNDEGKSTLLRKEDFSVVIPPKYDILCCFWDGLADVKLNGKYGFIDINGNEVIPIIYDYVSIFVNGVADVELNGRKFKIDKNGNEIID